MNQEIRLRNACYHTAAPMLGNRGEQLNPKLKAVKGHSFPGEAYVEFQGADAINPEMIQEALRKAILKNEKTTVFAMNPLDFEEKFYKIPYSAPEHKKFRSMQIGKV